MTEAQIREAVSRATVDFRARSGTTAYAGGHALQPSDTVRLTDEILAALRPLLIARMAGRGAS